MSAWIVEITDACAPAMVGHAGGRYVSPPHTDEQAKALLWLLLGAARKPGERGPWRLPIAGGKRLISLRRCPSPHKRKDARR
jgi:hypothetical protein